MSDTAERIKKSLKKKMNLSESEYNKRMDQLDEEYRENRKNHKTNKVTNLKADLTDYDRYNSSKKERAVSYDTQRNMGVLKKQKPSSEIVVSFGEALEREIKSQRKNKKLYKNGKIDDD